MAVYANGRGQTVTSELTHAQACDHLAKADPTNWVFYWLHRYANNHISTAQQVRTPSPASGAIQYIADTFVTSAGYGLQRPRLRVHFMNKRFKVYISRNRTICLKSGCVEPGTRKPSGRERYCGSFLRNQFRPGDIPLDQTDRIFLKLLFDDPREFILDCSRDMGMCCFCGAPLEDLTSKCLGYGPICAKRLGLPWSSDEAYLEKAPSFAKIHDETASRFCDALRDHPEDATLWDVYSDWLQEHGLPALRKRKQLPLLPRLDSGGGPIRTRPTPEPWIRRKGLYISKMSLLPAKKECPRCGEPICQTHATEQQDNCSGLRHPCGARLIVFNL